MKLSRDTFSFSITAPTLAVSLQLQDVTGATHSISPHTWLPALSHTEHRTSLHSARKSPPTPFPAKANRGRPRAKTQLYSPKGDWKPEDSASRNIRDYYDFYLALNSNESKLPLQTANRPWLRRAIKGLDVAINKSLGSKSANMCCPLEGPILV